MVLPAALVVLAALLASGIIFFGHKPGALSAARETVRAAIAKFTSHRTVSNQKTGSTDHLTDESAGLSASYPTAQKKIGGGTLTWDAGVTEYKARLTRYDFAGAFAVMANTQATDPSLQQTQLEFEKKAQWLDAWKNKLITDLNRTRFSGAITDVDRAKYNGIVGANPERLMLKTRYGIVGLPWPKLGPKMLLAVSASFIWPDNHEAVDRQWLCAVFASATGQIEAARQFAEAAAKAKPAFRREMSLILPTTSASR